jgi:hypothetical protein
MVFVVLMVSMELVKDSIGDTGFRNTARQVQVTQAL